MRLLEPLVPDPTAPLPRANPVAKLAAAFVVMGALFVSLDLVTASIVLGGLVLLLPITGLSPAQLLRRTWLILFAAVSVAIFNVVFAAEQLGPELVRIGPLAIGAETAVNGVGLGVRLLGIALSGVLGTKGRLNLFS